MATIVKRGAGRPAATARTNRAAQRTPLPPRQGQITDEMLQQAAHVVELQNMGAVKLRAYARSSGLTIPNIGRLSKEDLLSEILAAEDTSELAPLPPAPIKRNPSGPAEVAKAVARTLAGAKPKPSPAQTKSDAKAGAFLAEAANLGWTGSPTNEGERTTVVAKRGDETIEISWLEGVFQGDSCVYVHAGRSTIKIHNASAAKKRMALSPDSALAEAQKVTAHKSTRAARKPGSANPRVSKLPFSEASLDHEVLDALHGRRITFVNSVSGAEEVDRVPHPKDVRKLSNAPRISEGPRGRLITFVGQAGFRDVLLSSIVQVR